MGDPWRRVRGERLEVKGCRGDVLHLTYWACVRGGKGKKDLATYLASRSGFGGGGIGTAVGSTASWASVEVGVEGWGLAAFGVSAVWHCALGWMRGWARRSRGDGGVGCERAGVLVEEVRVGCEL